MKLRFMSLFFRFSMKKKSNAVRPMRLNRENEVLTVRETGC